MCYNIFFSNISSIAVPDINVTCVCPKTEQNSRKGKDNREVSTFRGDPKWSVYVNLDNESPPNKGEDFDVQSAHEHFASPCPTRKFDDLKSIYENNSAREEKFSPNKQGKPPASLYIPANWEVLLQELSSKEDHERSLMKNAQAKNTNYHNKVLNHQNTETPSPISLSIGFKFLKLDAEPKDNSKMRSKSIDKDTNNDSQSSREKESEI